MDFSANGPWFFRFVIPSLRGAGSFSFFFSSSGFGRIEGIRQGESHAAGQRHGQTDTIVLRLPIDAKGPGPLLVAPTPTSETSILPALHGSIRRRTVVNRGGIDGVKRRQLAQLALPRGGLLVTMRGPSPFFCFFNSFRARDRVSHWHPSHLTAATEWAFKDNKDTLHREAQAVPNSLSLLARVCSSVGKAQHQISFFLACLQAQGDVTCNDPKIGVRG